MTTQIQTTSLNAFFSEVVATLGERHKSVLEAMKQRQNFTNTELSEFLGWSINRVTPRVKELRQKGFITEDIRRECKITNRIVIAWKLVTKGQQALF